MTSRIHELLFAPTAMWDRISESVHDLTPIRFRHAIGLRVLDTFGHGASAKGHLSSYSVAKVAGTARWTGGSKITGRWWRALGTAKARRSHQPRWLAMKASVRDHAN